MAALITKDFTLPEEYSKGVFKKAQTSSVLARLSGSQPQFWRSVDLTGNQTRESPLSTIGGFGAVSI